MKQVRKCHGVPALVTAVLASMIVAACGGGQGDENVESKPGLASTEPTPAATTEEATQDPSEANQAPASTEPVPVGRTEEVTQSPLEPNPAPVSTEPTPVATTEEVVQAPSESAMLPAATTCGLPNFQSEVLRLVNEMRSQSRYCGNTLYQSASVLGWNSKLFAAAAGHAEDMASKDYFSHTSLDGRTASQRVTEAGYAWRTTGENIAAGQKTIADAMQGWSDSPGHCANIMNPSFTEVAVSCAASDNSTYKQYWTMSLGAPR